MFMRELHEAKKTKEDEELEKEITSGVDHITYYGPAYAPQVKPGPSGKGKNKKPPTTTKAMNSLIQTLWFYNNADAD